MEKQTEKRLMGTGGGEEEEGEMYGESNLETNDTKCKIDRQWEFAIWLRGFKQVFCNLLEGRGGEGGKREVWQGGDMGALMAESCWCLTENNKIL